jgi:hypothetical protein
MVIVKLIKIEIEDGMWEVWDSNPPNDRSGPSFAGTCLQSVYK